MRSIRPSGPSDFTVELLHQRGSMALATLLLVASLSLAAGTVQDKQAGRGRGKVVTPSKEHIAKVIEKRKAFRSRIEGRRKAAKARFEASQKAFLSKQQATLEEENRNTRAKIKRGS